MKKANQLADAKQALVSDLAKSFKRDDGVLYLVVMQVGCLSLAPPSQDYFLMPMTSGNVTRSPKVTIVIPSLAHQNNSSVPKMLRIETQVVGTDLFELPDKLASVLN